MLARLMPREIHADVNTGFTLVECLQEINKREAKHEELRQFLGMVMWRNELYLIKKNIN